MGGETWKALVWPKNYLIKVRAILLARYYVVKIVKRRRGAQILSVFGAHAYGEIVALYQ
jgi:hypothetical protein